MNGINIVVPMAGMGKRMRPHTLTTAKPLVPIAGKPIVERLCEDIAKVCNKPINHIAFVTGDFSDEINANLLSIAKRLGAEGHICPQVDPLGTGHAVMCAKEYLEGEVIVAFSDTLFVADFELDSSLDGTIWVHKVENPSSFGVVKLNESNVITDFVEKPEEFVSDLAIIGIYHFTQGEKLRTALQYLLDNDIKEKGEYQLTNALESLKQDGAQFKPGAVKEWMDCGNKNATVHTNQRVIEHNAAAFKTEKSVGDNCTIIEPCFIAEGVTVNNSTIGPHVSIGKGTVIENSIISNSIIMNQCKISNAEFTNSMIGNEATWDGSAQELSISDYSTNIKT